MKNLGTFKGASYHSGMSNQYNIKNVQPVNHPLKLRNTQETPGLAVGGSERVPVHQKLVQVSFQKQNTVTAPQKIKSINKNVNRAISGAAKEATNLHPRNAVNTIVLPSLTADKRDFTFGAASNAGKVTSNPKNAYMNRVSSVRNSGTASLWDNDKLADNGGRITEPSTRLPRRDYRQMDPGRLNLQQKPHRVEKRR